MINLRQLIHNLYSNGLRVTAEELADAIWLAGYLKPSGADDTASSEEGANNEEAQKLLPSTSITPGSDQNVASSTPSHVKLYSVTGEAGESGREGIPFTSPTVTPLPEALNIARALRPLRRRVPSRTTRILDETETVRCSADVDILMPILKLAPERWFEVALVVDESTSILIWQQMIIELQSLLMRHGAFRDVRVWSLAAGDTLHLFVRSGPANTRRRVASPRELIDPSGRRLILVVSDCITQGWSNGRMAEVLDLWGSSGPVAIIQVLPRRLWLRSGLDMRQMVRLRSSTPGAPNKSLTAELPRASRKRRSQPEPGPRVPILTLEPDSLLRWAQHITGAGDVWTPGVVFTRFGHAEQMPVDSLEQTDEQQMSVPQRIQRFRGVASPSAYTFACLLAAFNHVNLPIMRLVLHVGIPQASPSHLAEVFLSGLLKPFTSDSATIDPEQVVYDFKPGVREELLRLTPAKDIRDIVNEVSLYVDDHIGQLRGFGAWLAGPDVEEVGPISKDARPFAIVSEEALSRLGSKYVPYIPPAVDVSNANIGPHGIGDVSIAASMLRQDVASRPDSPRMSQRFDPSLFVQRPAITTQLMDHLLAPTSDPRYKRSLILGGPPKSGKSWLLKHIEQDQLPNHPQHPIVLSIDRRDFEPGFYDPEDLFVPVVERLWGVIQHYSTQHLATANSNYLPKPTGNKDEILTELSFLAQALDKLHPKPYIIILVDGMEEIIEISEERAKRDPRLRQQKDLLWRFETTCIEPLSKYQNMRLLATCRPNVAIGWRTFLVRSRTETKSLDEFNFIDKQFERLYAKEMAFPTSPVAMSVTLSQIQSELAYYQWNNPGANACLIKKAFLTGGTLDKAAVNECIDGMLTSPAGQEPLRGAGKDYLRQLISRFPHIDTGVKVVEVGQELRLNDAARNDFISDLNSRGVAHLAGYLLKIQPAIVALVLDWFNKP